VRNNQYRFIAFNTVNGQSYGHGSDRESARIMGVSVMEQACLGDCSTTILEVDDGEEIWNNKTTLDQARELKAA
jgi:hypothetical protein